MLSTMQEVNNFLEKHICIDVLINHVYPFARQSPPPSLLRDIRSFSVDIALLDTLYTTHYNPYILHTDLMFYLTNTQTQDLENSIYGEGYRHPTFIYVYRRLWGKEFATTDELFDIHNKFGCKGEGDDRQNNVTQLNRRIWGLLTPEERTDFINRYVIEEEEEIEDDEELWFAEF